MKKMCVILSLMIVLSGCAVSTTPMQSGRTHLFSDVNKIKASIRLLETNMDSMKDGFAKRDSYLRLAVLLSHPQNPEPNYQKAIEMLDKYTVIVLGGSNADMADYFRGLLETIRQANGRVDTMARDCLNALARVEKELHQLTVENNNLHQDNKKLRQNTRELSDRILQLEIDNSKMNDKLARLRSLDIRLEKKRGNHHQEKRNND